MKTILLVEDDPFLTEIYSLKLKGEGFSVSVAVDGEDCLRKSAEEKPNLILLDIVLPKVDGWEILRKIKQDKSLDKTRVIILSNLGQQREVERGLNLGADKYLIKAHYTPSEVVEQVKKVLK